MGASFLIGKVTMTERHRAIEAIDGQAYRGVLCALVLILIVPEALLLGADNGLWGFPDWRMEAYRQGAFWPGLLAGGQPIHAHQTWMMFVSYGFLHADALHLILNLVTLCALGTPILREVGAARFLTIYGVSMVSGGIAFAVLAPSDHPMVGASGALFGLVGAIVAWNTVDAWRAAEGIVSIGKALLVPSILLALLNLAMYTLAGGHLAWETHLGGYIAGLVLAPILASPQTQAVPA